MTRAFEKGATGSEVDQVKGFEHARVCLVQAALSTHELAAMSPPIFDFYKGKNTHELKDSIMVGRIDE